MLAKPSVAISARVPQRVTIVATNYAILHLAAGLLAVPLVVG